VKLDENDHITTGFYVITNNATSHAMSNSITTTPNRFSAVPINPANVSGSIIINPSAEIVWYINENAVNNYTIRNNKKEYISLTNAQTLTYVTNTNLYEFWNIHHSTDINKPGTLIRSNFFLSNSIQYTPTYTGWCMMTLNNSDGQNSSLYRLSGEYVEYERVTDLSDLTNGYYVILAGTATTQNASTIAKAMDVISTPYFTPVDVFYDSTLQKILYIGESSIWKIENENTYYTFFSVSLQAYIQFTGSSTTNIGLEINPSFDQEKFNINDSTQGSNSGHKFFQVTNIAFPSRSLKCNYPNNPPYYRNYETTATTQSDLAFFKMVSNPIVPNQVATPTFAPSTVSPFFNPFTLTIICDTDDAMIYYTIDGSEPIISRSSQYTEPIMISAAITEVRAIAIKEGYIASEIQSTTFNISIDNLMYSLPAGVYSTTQLLEISNSTIGAEIYYTTNINTIIEDFDLFTDNLEITETTSVSAYALHELYGQTNIVTSTYVITTSYEGTFNRITDLNDLETGYYVITSGINAMENTIFIDLSNNSNYFLVQDVIISDNTIIDPTTHIVWHIERLTDVDDGKYILQSILIEKYVAYQDSENEAFLHDQVIDNQQKWIITANNNLFKLLNANTTNIDLQYNSTNPRFACYTGSQINPALYKLMPAIIPQLHPPLISPLSGEYELEVEVSIMPAIEDIEIDVEIRYTLDNTEPNENSDLYVDRILLTENTIVRAKAFAEGYIGSEETVITYVIIIIEPLQLNPPVINPLSGEYYDQVMVTIVPNPEDEVINIDIRYTIDGSEPTENSILYTNTLNIVESMTIRSKAFAEDYISSEETLAIYTIYPTKIEDVEYEIPFVTQIHKVYPNPLNTRTNAYFEVKVRPTETATVRIFNIKGQVIKEFTQLNSGIHKLTWDGKDNNKNEIASGVYFYQIVSPTVKKVKKIMIIK